MKKTYQCPMLNIYQIVQRTSILTVSATETGIYVMSSDADQDGEVLSRGNRGFWDDDE